LARDRELPPLRPGDIIGVENAGAYGYSMASNYNSRLRPGEALISPAGEDRLIRRRDRYEDLLRQL
jgi:diaminopimelate decarboxylase